MRLLGSSPRTLQGKSQSSQESHFSPEALATFRHQFLRDLSRRAQLLRTVRRGSAQRAGLPLSSKGHHPLDSILQQQQELKRSLASKQRGTGSRDSKRWSATIRALWKVPIGHSKYHPMRNWRNTEEIIVPSVCFCQNHQEITEEKRWMKTKIERVQNHLKRNWRQLNSRKRNMSDFCYPANLTRKRNPLPQELSMRQCSEVNATTPRSVWGTYPESL